MKYKYSICHPNKSEIEYPNEVLDENQVLNLVKDFPWIEKLNLMKSLGPKEVYFNPSLDFVNETNNQSLGLTAEFKNEKLEFSLWYNRPVKTRPFFGLFGKKEKIKVIDKWGFDKETAFNYLDIFLNKDYKKLEMEMKK